MNFLHYLGTPTRNNLHPNSLSRVSHRPSRSRPSRQLQRNVRNGYIPEATIAGIHHVHDYCDHAAAASLSV
ncbi:hypothetical protein PsorP6_000067 [Peronosclerospora sorghi]|uniref:Uncharacterized protein n=1 Tax=Peronosclerospora sorghi TaxID=230839 RepID=A0ACC0WSA6_9STRA|nr:hypothetical protein PsorP6_000067 [Peronosclerospora sorghi]